ncbi:hypothetical protein AFK68_16600 [Hydrocoleum sp. CS-953]|uniref:DUF928 domain-containing protein n=1 Tax=Hydrocoleum sp. CS-953 TaxID=1671698 RepID=UPI000B9C6C21|nr:DUF928 domain-containing protein [Hydrocoleum sp. CS-953]OZH53590.1 hypothetical protein AFK68_16600 [Hydrocoleum sp. CS-953]
MKIKGFSVVIIGICGLSVGILQPVAGTMKLSVLGQQSGKIEEFDRPLRQTTVFRQLVNKQAIQLWESALPITEKVRAAEPPISEFQSFVEYKVADRDRELKMRDGRRIPGGTRGGVKSNGGSCAQNEKSFLALINERNQWEKTLASHPNFWLYVPRSSSYIKFNLVDNYSEEQIYQTKFNIKSEGGFINFKLPSSAPPLKVAEDNLQTYSWVFTLNCGDKELLVKGVVKRMPANDSLISELESAETVMDKIDIYEKNDLWHETITELGNLRRSNPDDLEVKDRWNSLLQKYEKSLSEGGDLSRSIYNLSEEPIQDCCDLGDV